MVWLGRFAEADDVQSDQGHEDCFCGARCPWTRDTPRCRKPGRHEICGCIFRYVSSYSLGPFRCRWLMGSKTKWHGQDSFGQGYFGQGYFCQDGFGPWRGFSKDSSSQQTGSGRQLRPQKRTSISALPCFVFLFFVMLRFAVVSSDVLRYSLLWFCSTLL